MDEDDAKASREWLARCDESTISGSVGVSCPICWKPIPPVKSSAFIAGTLRTVCTCDGVSTSKEEVLAAHGLSDIDFGTSGRVEVG